MTRRGLSNFEAPPPRERIGTTGIHVSMYREWGHLEGQSFPELGYPVLVGWTHANMSAMPRASSLPCWDACKRPRLQIMMLVSQR